MICQICSFVLGNFMTISKQGIIHLNETRPSSPWPQKNRKIKGQCVSKTDFVWHHLVSVSGQIRLHNSIVRHISANIARDTREAAKSCLIHRLRFIGAFECEQGAKRFVDKLEKGGLNTRTDKETIDKVEYTTIWDARNVHRGPISAPRSDSKVCRNSDPEDKLDEIYKATNYPLARKHQTLIDSFYKNVPASDTELFEKILNRLKHSTVNPLSRIAKIVFAEHAANLEVEVTNLIRLNQPRVGEPDLNDLKVKLTVLFEEIERASKENLLKTYGEGVPKIFKNLETLLGHRLKGKNLQDTILEIKAHIFDCLDAGKYSEAKKMIEQIYDQWKENSGAVNEDIKYPNLSHVFDSLINAVGVSKGWRLDDYAEKLNEFICFRKAVKNSSESSIRQEDKKKLNTMLDNIGELDLSVKKNRRLAKNMLTEMRAHPLQEEFSRKYAIQLDEVVRLCRRHYQNYFYQQSLNEKLESSKSRKEEIKRLLFSHCESISREDKELIKKPFLECAAEIEEIETNLMQFKGHKVYKAIQRIIPQLKEAEEKLKPNFGYRS